jgi:hypothetical protein
MAELTSITLQSVALFKLRPPLGDKKRKALLKKWKVNISICSEKRLLNAATVVDAPSDVT